MKYASIRKKSMGIDEWEYTPVSNPQRVRSGDKEKCTEDY